MNHVGKTTNRGWNLRNAMIIVTNIPEKTTEDEFRTEFPSVKEIADFRFLKECKPSRNSKTAIIQFTTTDEAVSSADLLNGKPLGENILAVFCVKKMRDYVRVPGSTFLLASQDPDFTNKKIFDIFCRRARIDHFFANTKNKSNPHTGVAVFKNSNEYLKAERFINTWNRFEDQHIMAIRTPSLDDFYEDDSSYECDYDDCSDNDDSGFESENEPPSCSEQEKKKKSEQSSNTPWNEKAYFVPKSMNNQGKCKVDAHFSNPSSSDGDFYQDPMFEPSCSDGDYSQDPMFEESPFNDLIVTNEPDRTSSDEFTIDSLCETVSCLF